MTVMAIPANQPNEFLLPLDGDNVTVTSGEITDDARRAFWRNADVYAEAARRLADEQTVATYPARSVLDLDD